MVHGFVKQSGGHVRIYSEEGEGTTVKIYLPRLVGAEEVSAAPAGKPDSVLASTRARSRTRPSCWSRTMRACATTPRTFCWSSAMGCCEAGDAARGAAPRGQEAAHRSAVHRRGLAGRLNGRDARRPGCAKCYPRLPVLYTTGYTRNAIVHQGRLDPDVQLLNKPYTQQDLARKVRELLDEA